MNKDLEKLNQIVSFIPESKTLTFDMSRTNKHWLLDYEYFFLRPSFSHESLKHETIFIDVGNHTEMTPYEFVKFDVEESVKENWSRKISVGRIELLAWSKWTVEKCTGLFYLYGTNDEYHGIFCHSVDRVNEFIYVGQTMEQFFDLDKTLLDIQNTPSIDNDYITYKRKISKSQSMTYDKFLKDSEYLILDAELGMSISFELYQNLIDQTFIPLSQNDLSYTKLELVSNDEKLHFLWHVDDLIVDVYINNEFDYIDENIFTIMNSVLEHLGSRKRFVMFADYDFGQEYGLAFLGKQRVKSLGSLFRIDLYEF